MSTYRIGEQRIKSDDPGMNDALAHAYTAKTRPVCVCRDPGIEMYIAKVAGKFVIKRMPNSGGDHAPACDSYEPPPELSGLGQVMGTAIQEDPEEGLTALKLDFSLTKVAGRSAPIASGAETDSVKTDGNKLTLRGTLHYLWEEAGFNRWAPNMAGKRSWYVIRKYLMQAAEDKMAKGASLADILYIPESFNAEKKNEITQRRIAHMGKAAATVKGSRRLMIVIGEVKPQDRLQAPARLPFHDERRPAQALAQTLRGRAGLVGCPGGHPPDGHRHLQRGQHRHRFAGGSRLDVGNGELDSLREHFRPDGDRRHEPRQSSVHEGDALQPAVQPAAGVPGRVRHRARAHGHVRVAAWRDGGIRGRTDRVDGRKQARSLALACRRGRHARSAGARP
jgi:hypothetical protein